MILFEIEYTGKGMFAAIGKHKTKVREVNEKKVRQYFAKVYSKAEILSIKEI